jgi:hypothetical protein
MKLVGLFRIHLKEPCSEVWIGIRVLDAFSVHCGMKL